MCSRAFFTASLRREAKKYGYLSIFYLNNSYFLLVFRGSGDFLPVILEEGTPTVVETWAAHTPRPLRSPQTTFTRPHKPLARKTTWIKKGKKIIYKDFKLAYISRLGGVFLTSRRGFLSAVFTNSVHFVLDVKPLKHRLNSPVDTRGASQSSAFTLIWSLLGILRRTSNS